MIPMIPELLDKNIQSNPTGIAIREKDTSLSYESLAIQVHKTANFLQQIGVQKGDHVGLYMELSTAYIVAVLATIKAGAVFIPISPKTPKKRLQDILNITKPTLMLTQENQQGLLEVSNTVDTYDVTKLHENETFINASENFENIHIDENDPVYVFFTSGSTGEPKAILGRHVGLAHFINWEITHFNIEKDMTIGAMTPIMFDPSLRDILVPLCAGATLAIPNQETLDFSERLQWLIDEKIELIHAVPSIYGKIHDEICQENIQQNELSLRYILFAGEKLYADALNEWLKKLPETITIGNLYGPSETTLAKFCHIVKPEDIAQGGIISLGTSLPDTKLHLLNENLEAVAKGEVGEIVIETAYRSKGYLQKAMNESVFITLPSSDQVVYKTGDLGYLNADGLLMYSGRKDFQIKINGVRIEINEIEAAILTHAAVKKVTVLYNDDEGGNLIAYVQLLEKGEKVDYKAHLQDRLASNMWPAHYIEVAEFPLNANGKVDRKKLKENHPLPKVEIAQNDSLTPAEEKVHKIWAEVLKKETIGVHDNFFEIGGHSLNALVIISKLHKEFGTRFEIESFFQYTTIHEQATHLFATEVEENVAEETELESIPVVENADGIYIASNGQKRMFIHSRVANDASMYNITGSYIVNEVPEIAILQKSLEKLVDRHETLRTIFLEKEGEVYQKIMPVSTANPTLIHLQSSNADETEELLKKEFVYSFELEQEAAIHVGIIEQSDGKATIFYCMHHIISDGWSLEIFINDLLGIYNSLKKGEEPSLPEMRIQYKDYASYERANIEKLEASKTFWNEKLSGEITALDFPTSYERPVKQTYSGASLDAYLSEDTVQKLKNFCKAKQTTYFSSLMASLYTLLYKYSGQQDITVGIPAANRDHDDLHAQIGLFVNTLVIREKIDPELPFAEFLESVKQTMFEAFAHKNYPYDQLVEDLGIERDLSRNPLFDVMVNFQTDNKQVSEDAISDWNATEFGVTEAKSKFDFSFYFYDLENTTNVLLIYNTNLFTKAFAEDLLEHFLQLVDCIANNPETTLTQAQYLSDQEIAKIITGFNNSPTYPTSNCTLQYLVNEAFQKHANKTAIIANETEYTFAEIDVLSNKLANALLQQGVTTTAKVIINTKRDQWFLASVVACIKLGVIYIPLDEETPDLLKNNIAEENACKVIIDVDFIANFEENIHDFSKEQPTSNTEEYSQTTILYTTGSTSKPKGVLINQKNIINRLEWMWHAYPFQEKEVCSLKTSISFVDHIWELFGPFLKGIPLVCFDKMEQLNIPKFISKLEAYEISRIVLVPSLLKQILEYVQDTKDALPKLNYWTCSGEVLSQKIIHDFYAIFNSEDVKLLNIYGSTEVTADATCFDTSSLFAAKEEDLEFFEASIEGEIEALIHDFDAHEKIIHYLENNEYVSAFDTKAATTEESLTNYLEYLKKHVLPSVINIAQTKFIGHMTGPLPSFVRSMSNLVTRLNQNLVKIETSGVATRIETDVIQQFHKKIYKESEAFYTNYDYATDGILGGFTNGGTLSNITALYYAMNNCFPATNDFEGYAKAGLLASLKYYDYEHVVILGSRFCHYSFEKALKLFGLGKNAFELLELDNKTPEEIQTYITEKVMQLRSQKVMILGLVGVAGTTETGEVEPISILGDIAQDLQIHFHVDAAFGGAYLFSEKNEHLLDGIAKADSITICHHKQFYTPIGTSMFVLKTSNSALNSEVNSRYQARKGSYDLGKFSIEGTRNFNSLIVHGLLNVFGTNALGQVIDHNHRTATRFSKLISQHVDFELYQEPTMNIVLYRYIPVALRGKEHTAEDVHTINEFNTELQQIQFKKGNSFVSYTTVKFKNTNAIFFRTVLLNPYTTTAHLKAILEEQTAIAYTLEAEKFGTTNLSVSKYDTSIRTTLVEGSIIGKPISNVKIYILDQDLQIVPIGVQGMIYVAGENITEGYANDIELTQRKFISNPLNADEIIYNTGDYGKWTANGNIVYLGRKDNQHKIRGNRVNTLYLEKVIREMAEIKEAVIKFDEEQMIAYMTLENTAVTVETIQKYLNERLPKYMLPSSYIVLDKFPKNTSGKIDRKKLVESLGEALTSGDKQVLPSNEIEEKVLVIWEQLFEKRLSVNDDFFLIGGHSLNLMKLIIHYSQTFGVQLDLDKLFLQRTIVEHAKLIQEATKETTSEKHIPKAVETEAYPLSYGQESLLVLSQIKEAASAYNMPLFIELEEELHIENLNKAVNSTIERHEILRTVFKEDADGSIKQWILPANEVNFTVDYHDFSQQEDAGKQIETYIQEDSKKVFNLTEAPLVRISVLKDKERTVFYYNMHHIISDAWSIDILYKDVIAYYNFYEGKNSLELPELPIQYKDYAVWQRAAQNTSDYEAHKAYWGNTLQDELPIVNLPSKKQRPPIRTHHGKRYNTFLSKEITSKLREFCLVNEGTVFMGLLSSLHVLISRYTNETDVIIGTPVAGRDHLDLEHQIGFYANAIALRNNINIEAGFKDVFKTIKENTLEAYQHKAYPFNLLLEELSIKRDMSRSAVFDVILTHQDVRDKTEEVQEESSWTGEIWDDGERISKFDLEVTFHEIGDYISFEITYNTDVYEGEIIQQFMQHYKQLLTAVLETSEQSVGSLDFIATEREKIITEFAETTQKQYSENSIVELFSAQAEKTPNAIVLKAENNTYTYQELEELSNQIAHCLQKEYNVVQNTVVGIKLDPSEWTLPTILGILKAGGTYVIMEPSLPENKESFIIEDSKAALLITDTNYMLDIFSYEGTMFAIDVEFTPDEYEKTPVTSLPAKEDIAYMIYTSGSTGNSKGVMISHESLVNYTLWAKEMYSKEQVPIHTGLFTSLAFDLTVTSLYLPIISGGSLTIMNPNDEIVNVLQSYLQNETLTHIKLTPAHINLIAELKLEKSQALTVIVGGDVLQKQQVELLQKLNANTRIFNEYGPTETTVGCTCKEITDASNITIGRPIYNTKAYVLNEMHQIQPIGIEGELCISGKGVASGYLNQPELTNASFVQNPFETTEKLYKTGDMVRWLPNGELVFIGRKDDQVKIDGYRIELVEIQQALLSKKTVKEAVIIVNEKSIGNKELLAYIVSEIEEKNADIKSHLSTMLPNYMIPHHIIQLEKMPLTTNGKVDKKALKNLSDSNKLERVIDPPRNETDEKVLNIWQKVFEYAEIGINDNIFEIGGNSLKVMQILNETNSSFNVDLELHTLMQNFTVKHISDELEKINWYTSDETDEPTIEDDGEKEYFSI